VTLRRALSALLCLVAVGSGASCAPAAHRAAATREVESPPVPARPPVGVTTRVFHDAVHDRELATTIWYPAAAGTAEHTNYWDGIFPGTGAWQVARRPQPPRLPLVLLSHGSGGDGSNLAWLAEALASHGYVAAAVDHPGDRFGDSSVEGRFAAWRRPPDLTTVLDQLLADPELGPWIDSQRVVAAGHSSGALAVLMLAGARLQPRAYVTYCSAAGHGPDCAFFDGANLLKIPDIRDAGRSYRDSRIRAIVALAPVLGPGVTDGSLRRIRIPVRIAASPSDELVPFAMNAARYQRLIPRARLTTVPEAGHFVFMPVCNEPGRLIIAQLCVDRAPTVDRAAGHPATPTTVIAVLDRARGNATAKTPDQGRRAGGQHSGAHVE
jgi:predicted dienelactone hydrolase